MKRRALHLALSLLALSPCAFGQLAPLDHAEILGRLAVGYSPSYIAHLVKTRGVNFPSSADFLYRVKLAGGEGILMERLYSADAPSQPQSISDSDPSFDHLAKCAELIHTGDTDSGGLECRAAIDENPKSPWALIATVQLLQSKDTTGVSGESPNVDQEEQTDFLRRAAALFPKPASARRPISVDGFPPDGATILLSNNASDSEGLEQGEMGNFGSPPNMFPLGPNRENSDLAPSSDEPITITPDLLRRIQTEPDLATNHVGLAAQYFQVRNFYKGESELQEAILLEPDNARLHITLGLLYIYRGNGQSGLAELREAVRIVPFGSEPRIVLAGGLEVLGRTSEATSELQNFLAQYPADILTSNTLVGLYLEHKDRKSAIAELRRSLKASSLKFSDQAKFVEERFGDQQQLAALLQENHETDAAAEQYLFLLRYKPDSADLHNNYGNVLLDQRRLDQAIAEYNKALRLSPEMSTPHHNIGLCLSLKKDFDRAIPEFQRALEINPNEPHARVFLGAALGQKGDLSAAMEQFQEAIKQNPEDADAHADVAFALMQLKDAPGAVKELKNAFEIQPDSAAAANNIAWIYATSDDPILRNPVEALALARLAVKNSPQPNSAFLDTLAEALLLNGYPAEALVNESNAIELDPENPDLKSRLPRFREAAQRPAAGKP